MRHHEFEPAKLLAGLVLLSTATLAALEAFGHWNWPAWWPLAAAVGGLGLAGLVAALSYGTRRAQRRAVEKVAALGPEPELRDMPMDDLRGRYEQDGQP